MCGASGVNMRGSAVARGSDHPQPFSEAASVASAGAAGNTTFGAGAQPSTAVGKPAGSFGSQAASISFGKPNPPDSSRGAPVLGAAASQQSPHAGNPAGPSNQPGRALTSADESSKAATAYAQLS